MRLNREARMAKKDIEAQIKKCGKLNDNFICLPDPEDVYTWYFIVFGLTDPKEYTGGFYFGRVKCKDTYPATAPNIGLYTDNGKFRTFKQQPDGICLSISDFHQESWNPAWKVSQIVMGLVSFWLEDEYTYGSIESYDFDDEYTLEERSIQFAMKSREEVLNHEKYFIFAPYAAAIGIDQEVEYPAWADMKETIEKKKAEKIKAEEERVRQAKIEAEKKDQEAKLAEIERIKQEKEAAFNNRHKIMGQFFKNLAAKGMTKFVGAPQNVMQKMVPVM